MTLHRSAFSTLVLLAATGALAPSALAWDIQPGIRGTMIKDAGHESVSRLVATVAGGTATTAVTATVESEAGKESLVLTESDAWLHGSAALSALPVKDTTLTLTLYDKASAALMDFTGTLGADGSVTLGEGESAALCEVKSKAGCEVTVTPDVELLAAELDPSGKGYTLTLDLAGADTYEVAYATVATSSGEKAEVGWEAVGSVWEAESTLDHTGEIEVKAKGLDREGETVLNVKMQLAEPWADDGAGANALSAGEGTSVALHRWGGEYGGGKEPGMWSSSSPILSVVSTGWSTSEYPTHAELEMAGGSTVTVAANSYQRSGPRNYFDGLLSELQFPKLDGSASDPTISISSGGFVLENARISDLASPVCSAGTCVVLLENEKGYYLSATTYGVQPGKLADKQEFTVSLHDAKGTRLGSDTIFIAFDSLMTAGFCVGADLDGDPIGGDASGSVRLLGAADKKGKQSTLSKGDFHGSFAVDSDGDLVLGGYGTDDAATAESSASVLLGDPVECGGAGCDGDWAPPAVEYRRIAAYVVGIRRVAAGIKLKGGY